MSMYYSFDGGEPLDFCSNKGYGDLCRWVDSLKGAYPELSHLRNYGWEQDLQPLTKQLGKAIEAKPPASTDVMKTAKGLLAALSGRGSAEVLTINNGIVRA